MKVSFLAIREQLRIQRMTLESLAGRFFVQSRKIIVCEPHTACPILFFIFAVCFLSGETCRDGNTPNDAPNRIILREICQTERGRKGEKSHHLLNINTQHIYLKITSKGQCH